VTSIGIPDYSIHPNGISVWASGTYQPEGRCSI